MFIAEEKILKKYSLKVSKVVTWEGIWGVMFSLVAVLIFNKIETPIPCDLLESCELLYSNNNLLFATAMVAVCIGPFNYFGVKLTQESSALVRCMICTSRMLVVWVLSIYLGWESFNVVRLVGYGLLIWSIERFNSHRKTSEQIPEEEEIPINLINADDYSSTSTSK